MRMTMLFGVIVVLGLQSCAFHASEKYACRNFLGWKELASPPSNAAELYALPNSIGRLDTRRYHEHWYEDSEANTLGSCRHLKTERTGCGTQTAVFVNTRGTWQMQELPQITICAAQAATR